VINLITEFSSNSFINFISKESIRARFYSGETVLIHWQRLNSSQALIMWTAKHRKNAFRKGLRQCVHRSVQWTLAGRMPERPLVPDTCRRARKNWRIGANTKTKIGRMGPWAISRRSCCKIPVAYPARYRDKGRKTLPFGGSKNGGRTSQGRALTPRGGNTQWQVTRQNQNRKRTRSWIRPREHVTKCCSEALAWPVYGGPGRLFSSPGRMLSSGRQVTELARQRRRSRYAPAAGALHGPPATAPPSRTVRRR